MKTEKSNRTNRPPEYTLFSQTSIELFYDSSLVRSDADIVWAELDLKSIQCVVFVFVFRGLKYN